MAVKQATQILQEAEQAKKTAEVTQFMTKKALEEMVPVNKALETATAQKDHLAALLKVLNDIADSTSDLRIAEQSVDARAISKRVLKNSDKELTKAKKFIKNSE